VALASDSIARISRSVFNIASIALLRLASSERLRAMLQNVLAPQSGGYSVASVSAGTTSDALGP